MSAQYRVAGTISPRGESYVRSWNLLDTDQALWLRSLAAFESACIIYDFEEALIALPFLVTNEIQLGHLKDLHKHIRVITGAEVGEALFSKSKGKAGEKESNAATQMLLQMLLNNKLTTEEASKLIIQLAK